MEKIMYTTSNKDQRINIFKELLFEYNLSFNQGSIGNIDSIEHLDNKIIDSASGNNAGQPYKSFMFDKTRQANNQISSFKMNKNDAIIYIGLTPPESDYFSFAPYLHERKLNAVYEKGDWMFAALGDPLNSANIKFEKTDKDDLPFSKQTVVIFTSDKVTFENIKELAIKAGFSEDMINLYVIPSQLLNMGVNEHDDSFIILLRTANYKNQNEWLNYLNSDDFGTVLHISPSETEINPFEIIEPKKRECIKEEMLVDGLDEALSQLKKAIIEKTSCENYLSFDSTRWFEDSYDVLVNEKDPDSPLFHKFVAGECSDTTYLRCSKNGTPINFKLGLNDMAVVYGVNHVATGLATYASFGVYGEWITSEKPDEYLFGCSDNIWNGVAGMTNYEFVNSAQQYLPEHPLAKYLYAIKVIRPNSIFKNEKDSVIIPTSEKNNNSGDKIALDKPIIIGYRAYLNPKTKIGPSYKDIINDKSILFMK